MIETQELVSNGKGEFATRTLRINKRFVAYAVQLMPGDYSYQEGGRTLILMSDGGRMLITAPFGSINLD